MKIELEVDAKQMEEISNDLSTFLKTLTDEQKMEILKGFAENQLHNIVNYSASTSMYDSRPIYDGKFTKIFADSLNNNIEEAIVKYFAECEDIIEAFKDKIQHIENHFDDICMQAIANFIADNILINKKDFVYDVMAQIRSAGNY